MIFIYNGQPFALSSFNPYALGALTTLELCALVVCKVEGVALFAELQTALGHRSAGTTSPLLAQLEKKGFIKTGKLESDKRVSVFTLTPKGQRAFKRDY